MPWMACASVQGCIHSVSACCAFRCLSAFAQVHLLALLQQQGGLAGKLAPCSKVALSGALAASIRYRRTLLQKSDFRYTGRSFSGAVMHQDFAKNLRLLCSYYKSV